MGAVIGIGEFSKMSYLTVKTLRHYHDVGLLEPLSVDPASGYRRYATSQVPVAHAIRRFRKLGMPIEDIRLVLSAPDAATRNRVILSHLERMQRQLEETHATVASLQAMLGGEMQTDEAAEIRRLPGISVLTEISTVEFDSCAGWLEPALVRLHDRVEASKLVLAGPDGALYSDEFFESGAGPVTAFVPVALRGGDIGEDLSTLPAVTVAMLVHDGPFTELDRTYGALGTIVAERGIGGPGPIRENYISATRTEVCWPITADRDG